MARGFGSCLSLLLVASLLVNAFCAPAAPGLRSTRDRTRPYRGDDDANDVNDIQQSASLSSTTSTPSPFDEDDDDDFGEPSSVSQSAGGGSSILSLLNLATALFPGSSSSTASKAIRSALKQYHLLYQHPVNVRRQDIADNVIHIDYGTSLTPPSQRQEDENGDGHDDSHDDDDDDDDEHSSSESEEDNAAEESLESNKEDNDKSSKQDSNGESGGDSNDDNDSDYSEEPEGDGQGGGILGLLAGLSGGGEGSDLGTLLATVSQIVGNLSGDGFDLNALLTSAFGLFVGLLSQGEENPGTVIASYLLTSLDTITGGGAQNNGAFFGNFLSQLVKGTSAGQSSSSDNQSSSQPSSPLWTLKMDILRAVLQFGTSILGLASASFTNASTL